jgi:hypothetical protein
VHVIGVAFSLVPQVLFVLLMVAGLVLVVQRGQGQPWARFAELGLVLILVGSMVNLVLLGGLAAGAVLPFTMGALYWLMNLMTSILHWAGIGLLVAAALSGRRASRPGTQLPE